MVLRRQRSAAISSTGNYDCTYKSFDNRKMLSGIEYLFNTLSAIQIHCIRQNSLWQFGDMQRRKVLFHKHVVPLLLFLWSPNVELPFAQAFPWDVHVAPAVVILLPFVDVSGSLSYVTIVRSFVADEANPIVQIRQMMAVLKDDNDSSLVRQTLTIEEPRYARATLSW